MKLDVVRFVRRFWRDIVWRIIEVYCKIWIDDSVVVNNEIIED